MSHSPDRFAFKPTRCRPGRLAFGVALALSLLAAPAVGWGDSPATLAGEPTGADELLLISLQEPAAVPIEGVAELLLEDGGDAASPPMDSAIESPRPAPVPRSRAAGRAAATWLGGADFLLLRPSFSNATAMLANTRTGGLSSGVTPRNSSLAALDYDFGFSGGVRGFVGYQADPCHVFRFTYLNFFAQTTTVGVGGGNWDGGNGTIIFGPYNTEAEAGESITSTAKVGLNIYDLEWARRIDVDPRREAPAWDAAAGFGIRFLDSRVSTSVFNNVVVPGAPDLLVTTNRTFGGVGPRVAGQVRRYFGARRRWSGFGSVGGSLLVGGLTNTDTRLTLDTDRTFEQQVVGGTTVIPNVDISLGGTWQVRQRTSLSIGWTLMYFGDLGYAEQVVTNAVPVGTPVTSVPLTTSSLTLDGAFFRFSHAF